jgi:hypothetical protein
MRAEDINPAVLLDKLLADLKYCIGQYQIIEPSTRYGFNQQITELFVCNGWSYHAESRRTGSTTTLGHFQILRQLIGQDMVLPGSLLGDERLDGASKIRLVALAARANDRQE